jgi:uncharacterized protein
MPGPIFAVPVFDRWLVYAPLHRFSAVVNSAALRKIRSGDRTGPMSAFFSSIEDDPAPVPFPRTEDADPDFLGLITTRECNCSCAYCGFAAGEAASRGMPPELAVSAVDWMAGHVRNRGRDLLDVHFFGGEPCAAWDVLEIAVHRARAEAARTGLTARFEIATNGVVDEERCVFLGDYFDTVVLSFDGPKPVHDRHRPTRRGTGSFEAVRRSAEILSRSGTELCFRTCVTAQTAGRMESTAVWFGETFGPSVIHFETLQPTDRSRAAGLRPPDPYDFAAQYRSAARSLKNIGIRPGYAADISSSPRNSFCPVGTDAVMIDPDGLAAGCYLLEKDWRSRGLDMRLGRFTADGGARLDPESVNRLRRMAGEKPGCDRCFCRWTCAGGCLVNRTGSGQPDDFCVQTRLISACSLLDEMEEGETADRLMENADAMRNLALHGSDLFDG